MAYDIKLADRIREYLAAIPKLRVKEKAMFSGLAFMINGKMCINVSNDNLMCRFHPEVQEEISNRNGFIPMVMKGKALKGYCYVSPEGFKLQNDFKFWLKLCLTFNPVAKASKKKSKS